MEHITIKSKPKPKEEMSSFERQVIILLQTNQALLSAILTTLADIRAENGGLDRETVAKEAVEALRSAADKVTSTFQHFNNP